MEATQVGPPYACATDPTQLCRNWQITIPPKHPQIDTYVYLPGKSYLQSLSLCSAGDQQGLSDYYDQVLAHEVQHVDIHNGGGVSGGFHF